MMEVTLLAPGPSMSRELADSLRSGIIGVVSNCFELAPWADFLVAQDRKWWQTYPQALRFAGRRFSGNRDIAGVEYVVGSETSWNSGVLALQAAVQIGATRIRLHGFDMHGSHFFGPYANGLPNTNDRRRESHQSQYSAWAARHRDVEVINYTPGSALRAFPIEEMVT